MRKPLNWRMIDALATLDETEIDQGQRPSGDACDAAGSDTNKHDNKQS
ncbi:MAG: hypothetical protein ABL901_04020 [Hyphomicrobiaceae bacterium]